MPDGLAKAPPDPIARDGLADRAGKCKADARSVGLRFADEERREQGTGIFRASVINPAEILGAQQTDTFRKTRDGYYLSELTVSFLRPRARRRARTARPFFVSIRERNPCVFARWRLFG
jgi:hypothetical protein